MRRLRYRETAVLPTGCGKFKEANLKNYRDFPVVNNLKKHKALGFGFANPRTANGQLPTANGQQI
jgi:hypothetical protein